MTSNGARIRKTRGSIVLVLVLLFVALLAIVGFALDASSRGVLVEVWKAETGHQMTDVCHERFVSALGSLGKDIAKIDVSGPDNAIANALMSATRETPARIVVPTTMPEGIENLPIQLSDVHASFQLVSGNLEGALREHPLSESQFVPTSPTMSHLGNTDPFAGGHDFKNPPPPSNPRSSPPMARATDYRAACACGDHSVCFQDTTTTESHLASVAVVAITLEATATFTADRQTVRRTLVETKLAHVLASHEPTLKDKVWVDVPKGLVVHLAPFYVARRIREDGRE